MERILTSYRVTGVLVIKKLSKLGKFYRVQTEKQFKYVSIKAEDFSRMGYFGTSLNKHFARWYDGKLNTKASKERDKWQLIRDKAV
ncbi:hypothetical protein RhiirA5_439536 [Rhizophagus irregularis]|uniref:Uncharacterized protein n=1 Tax=Rhizophagus irregularis TaxID=588596 RepID=A0A2N0NHS1_9GLOM|nr:hypothetical protein RhiirA5_439536 [Rhizophagus irregularis]GET57811.1 hypothetical protein GLOIN_2v1487344 [Rhizophagus irregularis DAOM 181602=DAOM 197198]